ncbi:hypothetical protein BBK82_21055 [Lentzea guizhouensis]|uniref:Uncharacterized protein n=1 Tax=Lentzea guizhouensis TaxID=1586287 RepID=A0A1B2HKE1_9PSEU|nr:DUF6114 domain-containing protein [Lentzea guizhouensis]ANZ38181.1 hypothetical protein BBK82_21055 [Lentzea guizhouensis]
MLLRFWRSFTAWRRGRPFWAGLFVIAGAIVILFPPFVGVKLGDMIISIKTIGGVSALLVGTLLIICGLSLWVAPKFRLASGIVTVLLAMVALVTTNLGGFLVGTVLSLLGGALAVAWTDSPKEPRRKRGKGRSELSMENPAPPVAAVALIALLAVQPPSSDPSEPPTSTPAPTSSSVVPPTSSTPPATTTAPTPAPTPGPTTGPTTGPPTSSSAPTVPPSSTAPPSATPPPVPAPVAGGRAWTLTASRLDLGGLNFAGVVDSVLNGEIVKVLKFTTSDMKIRDLVQTGEVSPGVKLVTRAAPGSTSTVSVPSGSPNRIELFTVQLKGNLDILGIKIPVDYTAAHPPPLNVPIASFTEVTVRNADLVGGTLKIPGAQVSLQTA